MDSWHSRIEAHYAAVWGAAGELCRSPGSPNSKDLPKDFAVLRFAPRAEQNVWAYATRGMSQPVDAERLEVHMFSPKPSDRCVEILVTLAHFHRTGHRLGLGHTVNFGVPWARNSVCDHGLISLPYLDGPKLENLDAGGVVVRFLWLIPISLEEREFKIAHGLDALEERFEDADFEYSDPLRPSVV